MTVASGSVLVCHGLCEENAEDEHRTAPAGAVERGTPPAAPAGGAGEPDALRGARRAGPQFPRPVTRLASLPRRVAAAKGRLRSARRQGRWPITAVIGPGTAEVPLR